MWPATMERSRVGTIKYAVAEAFHKDPYGIDAIVTADMDLSQRLREVRSGYERGRPFAGIRRGDGGYYRTHRPSGAEGYSTPPSGDWKTVEQPKIHQQFVKMEQPYKYTKSLVIFTLGFSHGGKHLSIQFVRSSFIICFLILRC